MNDDEGLATRLPSVLDLLLVEGVGDLLLLAAAGDRLCQLLGGESAHLPLLLSLPSLLAGLLLPAPTSLPLLPLLLLLSLLPALLPPLLSRLPTEVLLPWVLLSAAAGTSDPGYGLWSP